MVTRGIAPVAIDIVDTLVFEQTLAKLLVACASQNAACQKALALRRGISDRLTTECTQTIDSSIRRILQFVYDSNLHRVSNLPFVHDAHALPSGVVYRIIGIDIYYIDAVLNPCKARAAKAPKSPATFKCELPMVCEFTRRVHWTSGS
jgi:hypothetical protein